AGLAVRTYVKDPESAQRRQSQDMDRPIAVAKLCRAHHLSPRKEKRIFRPHRVVEGDEIRLPRQDIAPIAKLVTNSPMSEVLRRMMGDVGVVEAKHIQTGQLRPVRQRARRVDGKQRLLLAKRPLEDWSNGKTSPLP